MDMNNNGQIAVKYVDFCLAESNDDHEEPSKPLKINGNNISFFDDNLSRTFRFLELDNGDWLLTFFANSPFDINIKIAFGDQPIPHRRCSIGSAFRIDGDGLAEAVIQKTRELLGSKSLDKTDYQETALNSYLTTSGRGFVYVTTKPGQFERAVLLNALVLAYKHRMQTIASSMSSETISGKPSPEVLKWCNAGFVFNAAFYTKYPIKLENREIRNFLAAFEEHWRISDINDELMRQLNAIHSLLQFNETQATAERHHSQNTILAVMIAVIGLFITLLSTYLAHVWGWNN